MLRETQASKVLHWNRHRTILSSDYEVAFFSILAKKNLIEQINRRK